MKLYGGIYGGKNRFIQILAHDCNLMQFWFHDEAKYRMSEWSRIIQLCSTERMFTRLLEPNLPHISAVWGQRKRL